MKHLFTIKNLVLLLGIVVFSFSGMNAQEAKYKPSDIAGFQVEVMAEQLKLTQEQMQKLIAFNKADAAKEKAETPEEAKKRRDAREATYKEVLTAEQYKQWLAQRDEINEEAQYRYLTSDAYANEFAP